MSIDLALFIAAALIVLLSVAHSYLGERYILVRLFRRDNLPKLFGGVEFTIRTLRFAWHVTSIAWLGLAAILLLVASQSLDAERVGVVVGATFLAHFAIALLGSRGKHLSWPLFLLIGLIAIFATRA